MRKPDPQPGTEPPRKKRSSAAAVMSTSSQRPASTSSTATDDIIDMANDTEKRTTQEDSLLQPVLPLRGINGSYIDPETFAMPSSRPGSAAAMYFPGPPTRTTGSTTSSSSSSAAPSSVVSTNGIKRPKSRPQLPFSEEDSDGAEADAEYIGSGHMSSGSNSGWGNVNMESGRRRGVPKRSAAAAAVVALEDIRRHSMAL